MVEQHGKTLVPQIRFAGFTDPWEQRKLGDCGSAYGGLSGKTKEDFGRGTAKFVPYTNVFDNPITDSNRLESIEKDSKQNEVRYGDALFTVSSETPGEVGMSSVWLSDQPNVYLNSFCFGYRQDGSFDSRYLAYMLRSQNVRSDLTLLAQGISRFNISKNKVMELKVPYPGLKEQAQLGAFFDHLDSLITLHQRKYDKLCVLKKSMLDKMFPKGGSLYPEIRFAGFTDPWEQRKLGELTEIKDSARIPNRLWREAGVPYIRASDISQEDLRGALFIDEEDYAAYKAATGAPEKGDVLFNGGGEIGKAIINGNSSPIYVQGGAVLYARIAHSSLLDARYLVAAFVTQNVVNAIGVLSAGGTMKHFTLQPAKNLPIEVPSIAEQRRIGAFFDRLDSLITLHQRKLELLRNIKKSMLDKMFV